MRRRFLIGLAAVAAASVVVAAPALGAVQKCHTSPPAPSAENIYVDQVPGSGSCGKKNAHGGNGQTSGVQQVVPVSTSVAKKLRHTSKKNKALLTRIATSTQYGASKPVQLTNAALHAKAPSTLGAAFDLGSGPTTLFGALLAAAVLLALGGSLRHRKR